MSGSPEIDTDRPHPARVYDYLLGGACNFEPDRAFAAQIVAAMPQVAVAARVNREFLRRAVRFCTARGIDQFLDLGSGIPTVGNVHETAPGARVVYVDSDPIAVAHSEIELRDVPNAGVVLADLLDVDAVLGSEAVGRLLDLDRPLAVLVVAVLHFVPEPAAALARYVEAMAPGGVLVLSHGTSDAPRERSPDVNRAYAESGTPGIGRDRAQIAELCAGVDLVDPGIVWTAEWHPDAPLAADPSESMAYAAVGIRS